MATGVNAHCGHAMILDCILVDVDPNGAWKNKAFRFKNTDPNNKAIEVMVNGKLQLIFLRNSG